MVPFILKRPAAYLCGRVSVMTRIGWRGFAYDMPFAQIIAIATLVSTIYQKAETGAVNASYRGVDFIGRVDERATAFAFDTKVRCRHGRKF
jgi:hypothetical protein